MKIGLVASTAASILAREDDDTISPADRGRRFINSLLYKSTKPQELALPLALLAILNNESLYFFSHAPAKIKLSVAAACFKNANEAGNYDTESDEDEGESEFVHVTIPMSQLQTSQQTEDSRTNHEMDSMVNLSIMTDYWHRPVFMEDLSYIDVLEGYHLKQVHALFFLLLFFKPKYLYAMIIISQGKTKDNRYAMTLGHPNPDKRHWAENDFQAKACGIVYGGELPNLDDLDKVTPEITEYYYKALLVLFKPHRKAPELLSSRKFSIE